MIHIDRQEMKEPAWFRSPQVLRARKRITAHFALPVGSRPQVRSFDPELLKEIQPAVMELCRGKCAYCERSLAKEYALVEQYRPVQLAGDPKAKDHYWWLAYDWNNLLMVCKACSAAKRELFPLWGERCMLGATGDALRVEYPVILDPTVHHPEDLLAFLPDGTAAPRYLFRDRALHPGARRTVPRAQALIRALQLNRSELLLGRKAAIHQTRQLVEEFMHLSGGRPLKARAVPNGLKRNAFGNSKLGLLRFLLQSLSAEQPFAGARRWTCYLEWERLLPVLEKDKASALFIEQFRFILNTYERIKPLVEKSRPTRRTKKRTVRRRIKRVAPELANIAEVRVKNFRVVQDARFIVPELRPKDLEVPSLKPLIRKGTTREWGWKMLLGENGAGKSTLLQAIAIALMGERYYERASVKRALQHSSLRRGAKEGSIIIRSHQSAEPIEVRVGPDGLTWVSGAKGADIFLRAYGSTRLLPRKTSAAKKAGRQPLKKVDNLFDPYAPLLDAEAWLRGLGQHELYQVTLTLRDLLGIKPRSGRLTFEKPAAQGLRKGRFGLMRGRHFTPLEHFSAGYQTVLGMACDIMAGAGTSVQDMARITGIVLIDEIGINLHPTWRLRVLDRLGQAFPRMQLIASTHEPLCLRGMGAGEVAIVERKRERVRVTDDMPSPTGYRVDQLLTSEFFGMNTTFDESTELAFNTYYDLLAKGSNDTALMNELSSSLSDHSILGNTRRDQVILKAVDQFLAKDRDPVGSASRIDPSPEVVKAIERSLLKTEGT